MVAHLFDGSRHWALSEPQYWAYPLQSFACSVLLILGWRSYRLTAPGFSTTALALAAGGIAFVVWIAPQCWMAAAPRTTGFNPEFFGAAGGGYLANVGFRFFRLVIVVPLVEEIFWRGFLLRYLIDEDFTRVPLGAFSWKSWGIVMAGFCLEHARVDWLGAFVTGVLYNLVIYRTRSLSACVLAHAVTNLLLGLYVMKTRQWGFW